MAELVSEATGGRVLLGKENGVGPACAFAAHICMGGDCYPAFADGHPGTKPADWIIWLFRKTPDGRRYEIPARSIFSPGQSLYQQVMLADRATSVPLAPLSVQPPLPLRDEFPAGGVLVARDGAFAVALKGGHNAEPHNHNDVGSYVVRVDKETPVLDPGGTEYTAETFSAKRYEHPILSSFGHSVPVVNGHLQTPGKQSRGVICMRAFSEKSDTWGIDLTSCYPGSGVKKLVRIWNFRRGVKPSLTVLDRIAMDRAGTFETAVIGSPDWARCADGTWLVKKGAAVLRVAIMTSVPFETTLVKIGNARAFEPGRLGVRLKQPVREAEISITLEPATAGQWQSARPVGELQVVGKNPGA